MPIVVNNNFSEDSFEMRSERLSAIQGNFATIQPELSAPDYIAECAEDCYDVYAELWTNYGVEDDQIEAATLDFNSKLALMEEEYQNAKYLAISIYRDNQTFLKQFEFDMRFPDSRNARIEKCLKVLKTHENHIDAGVSTLLPTAIITRLTNAVTAAEEAKWVQDKERGEAGHQHDLLLERFDSDSEILKELKSWWFAMMGKKDSRITWVGMVNPSTGGSGGNQISAPTNFRYDYADRTVRWNAVNGATSYQLESSDDNTTWDVMYEGGDTEFFTGEMLPDHKYLRIRSRDANGFSSYTTYNVIYEYVLNGPTNLTHNPALPGFTWDTVPNATAYEVQLRLASGTDDDYNLIYFGNDTTLIHGDPNGSYYVRARSWSNSGLSGWHLLAYSVGV